ncbi:MAG: VOC family protein [Chloroflexi bacterium]|nr:VOC family protein [Chloroflexota bacterium]
MDLRRLDHIVLAVEETAPAVAAWRNALGLEAETTEQPDGTHMELTALPVGDAFLELVQPTTPDHRVARYLAERGEGMFSLSVEVDDLDGAVRELQAKGVPVSPPERGVLPNTRVARIPREAAHGVALQLIERKG